MTQDNWPRKKLEDLVDRIIDYRGKTPKKITYGIPLITAKIVKNGFIHPPQEYIAEKDYESWMVRGLPRKGDVLLTMEAPLGEVAQITDEKVALAQRLVAIRGNPKILDNTFLKYYLLSDVGQSELKNRETGTTVTGIKQSELRKIWVPLPPLSEQRAIADVLGSLDDKIELNRKMNANLESLAQALFKRTFLDNPERGEWEETKLGNVVENFDSKRIPLSSRQRAERQGNYPYYGATSIMDFIDNYIFDGIYILVAEDGSVVDQEDHPIIQYVWGKFWLNNHAHILKGTNGISDEQLLLFLKNVNILPYITGAVQLKLNQGNLNSIPFVLPPKLLCEEFQKTVSPLFAKIRLNFNENRTLIALRDTLLPKLMSGQVRVS